MRGKLIDALQGIKGIGACIIAFIWHYRHLSPNIDPLYKIFAPFYDCGDSIVELFFMLSGIGMLIGYRDNIMAEKISFAEYMARRIKKLYPTMLSALIATTFFQYFFLRRVGTTFIYGNYDIFHFILNFIGIQTGILVSDFSFNGPAWFISIILVCYIIFYVVSYLTRKNKELFVPICILNIVLGGVW